MKHISIISLVLFLTACAGSAPSYQAANRQGVGYSEVKLSDTRYRVVYKDRGLSTSRAMKGALQRAAELTLAAEQDWFIVQHRHVEQPAISSPAMPAMETYRQCGLLGCREVQRPTSTIASANEPEQVSVILTIELGHGIRPEHVDSYDAREYLEQQP